MISAFDRLQDELARPNPDYPALRETLREADLPAGEGHPKAAARHAMVARLAHALQQLSEGDAVLSDVIVLMRQVIRSHNRRLNLPAALWGQLSGRALQRRCLEAVPALGGRMEVIAGHWQPVWLPEAGEIDQLQVRRHDQLAASDGMLRAFMRGRADGYLSEAQKAAVGACLFATPGATTLVSLPTGSGKTLCVVLPAWVETRGGTEPVGTTLVIVPTVSLALDHERRAREVFANPAMPLAHVGGMDSGQRDLIRAGLRDGTLPLLFLSPEALLESGLYYDCLEAAKRGQIRRLVIDEVHLVETWGAGFRTEFQFLATYRHQLLDATQGGLQTVLLSATLSLESQALLEQLFAAPRAMSVIRANRLRPEPGYWFSAAPTQAEREARVLDALYHLPRPAILYVTRPDDANEWVAALRAEGFDRLAAFSGDTDEAERRRIIRDWSQDRRDLIVATAAFGLGVDKSDVRTVIHACLPENVDRFYQAVGRGGRDGLSAISLMVTAPDDSNVAFSLTKAERITAVKARGRWEGLVRTARRDGTGDRAVLDLDAPPSYDPQMMPGERHREWNEHVLLLMARAHMITIYDTRPEVPLPFPSAAAQPPAEAAAALPKAWLEIAVRQTAILNNLDSFETAFDQARTVERAAVEVALHKMRSLARTYSAGQAANCLAYEFARLYPGAILACGGCPACRQQSQPPYAHALEHHIAVEIGAPVAPYLNPALAQWLGDHQTLILTWAGLPPMLPASELLRLLPMAVDGGFQQLVLPDSLLAEVGWRGALLDALAGHYHVPHAVVAHSALLAPGHPPLYLRPTVIVYPADEAQAAHIFVHVSAGRVPLIHVIPTGLWLTPHAGRFVDRVNGLSMSLEQGLAHLDAVLGQTALWR